MTSDTLEVVSVLMHFFALDGVVTHTATILRGAPLLNFN